MTTRGKRNAGLRRHVLVGGSCAHCLRTATEIAEQYFLGTGGSKRGAIYCLPVVIPQGTKVDETTENGLLLTA